jgi:hypothetical protein
MKNLTDNACRILLETLVARCQELLESPDVYKEIEKDLKIYKAALNHINTGELGQCQNLFGA